MSNKSDLKPFSIFEAYDRVYFRLNYGIQNAKENLQAIKSSDIEFKDLQVEAWEKQINKGYERIYIGNLFFLNAVKINGFNSYKEFEKFDIKLYELLVKLDLV